MVRKQSPFPQTRDISGFSPLVKKSPIAGLSPRKLANTDAEQPLIEKQATEQEATLQPETLLTLFRYSSADAPLLLVAFTAGKPCQL